MTTTTYHRRKAAGLCALCGSVPPKEGYAVCASCRFEDARRKQPTLTPEIWRVHEALRLSTPQAGDTLALRRIPGPALLHCGQAWAVTPAAVRCGACGATYSEEPQP